MRQKISIVLTALLMPLALQAQIRGVVYHDSNRNGVQEGSEKGLSGISVSDGKEVVKTNPKGEYELPANPDARFVFVTTPSGYEAPENLYLPVSAASHDFGLVKNNHTGAFEFLQVTDTETHNYKSWIDNLREYAQTNPTAFIIHSGDICYPPGLQFHGTQVRTRHMGVPMYYTIGNHDLVKGDYGEQMYESFFGPAWYSFEAGNVHFLALPMLGGDYQPSYNIGQIIRWIRKDLANTDPAKKVIILDHDLWFQGGDLVIRDRDRNGVVRDSLDMSKHNLVAYLYGHWHNHYIKDVAGVKTIGSSTPDKGGIDHSAACFRVISIDAAGNVTNASRSRYTNIPGVLTAVYPALHDTVSIREAREGVRVRVNVYRTISPAEKVRVKMKGSNKSIELKPETDWAWSGVLASDDKPGLKEFEIEAQFKNGTRLVGHQRFVVSERSAATCNWVQNAGSNIFMSKPVLGDGRVYVSTIDDDNLENCFVVAYDAGSGREVWRYKTKNSVKNTMVYAEGLLLACDAQMEVYALDGKTGLPAWTKPLRIKGVLPSNMHGLAVENGILYAGQGGDFTALRVKDGSVVWKNTAWKGGEGTTSTAVVGEGVVMASGHWNGLFAHDAKTGALLWKKQDSNIRFRDGSPTFYKGLVYLASANGMFIIEPHSGDILKSQVFNDVSFHANTAPVVTEEVLYIATADRGVVAYDRETWKPLWNYKTQPALFYTVPYSQDYQMTVETTPVLVGDTLIFGASDGYLYGIDSKSGQFRWKRNLGAPVLSSPVVEGNVLYVADFSGNVYSINITE